MIAHLKEARAHLAAHFWTKGTFARDAHGDRCDPLSRQAVAVCGEGAIVAVCGWSGAQEVRAELAEGGGIFGDPYPPVLIPSRWNDAPERTKEEVLARFDETIARLERGA